MTGRLTFARASTVCVVLALALALGPGRARAQSTSQALEVGLFGGWGLSAGAGDADATKSHAGGPGAAGWLLYRSPHFLSPWLDVGWHRLHSSQQRVPASSPGGPATLSSSLSTLSFLAGPAMDLWRFRISAGVGAYLVRMQSKGFAPSISPTELDMGYTASLSGFLIQTPQLKLGIQARLLLISEAELVHGSVGITLSGDALRW